MSQIRYAGVTSDRVHRGASRETQKRARWHYIPRPKRSITLVDIQLFIECSAITFAWVAILFFVWLSAG